MYSKTLRNRFGRLALGIVLITLAGGCLNRGAGKSGTWVMPPAKVTTLPPVIEAQPALATPAAPITVPVKSTNVMVTPATPDKPQPLAPRPTPPVATTAAVTRVASPAATLVTNAAPAAQPEAPLPDFRTTVAVQTLLDRANFSPNCIDGKWGSHTRTALAAWQADRRLPVSGELDDATCAALGKLERAFTTHTITPEEHAALTPMPETWRGKAKVAALRYSTILETLAERYHAAEAVIEKLNPAFAWPDPPAGSVIVVPAAGGRIAKPVSRIEVALNAKLIRAYAADGSLVALFPCSIGGDASKRPVGDLTVIRCAKDPVFIFDPEVFVENEEARTIQSKLIIPSGPNNPVGVAWIGLNLPGYGIHGTSHPEDIGKTESHGCFRLANWNAGKLLATVTTGMPVTVK